jgi:hypothetical protein
LLMMLVRGGSVMGAVWCGNSEKSCDVVGMIHLCIQTGG